MNLLHAHELEDLGKDLTKLADEKGFPLREAERLGLRLGDSDTIRDISEALTAQSGSKGQADSEKGAI